MTAKSRFYLLTGTTFIVLLLGLSGHVSAGDPHLAQYLPDTNKIFWFIQTSDLHIGASGTQDSNNLQWLVGQARQTILPSFIIVTGDLTDSTNANIFGYPNGPYLEEWTQYRTILGNNVSKDNYYDVPGNHDAYNDQTFSYYRNYSMQGTATGPTQLSFTKDFDFGKYHFLGVNTADNTGDGFSIFWPYGDYAGLDSSELSFISQELASHPDANLTMVFGHHPLAPTGNSEDTYLYYGLDQFLGFMDSYYNALYGYGHTHAFGEAFFDPNLSREGFFYLNVASLGKSSQNQYTVFAVDCNGISSVTPTVNQWPVVLITAPVDKNYGNVASPYSYSVPAATSNPIRALVFDPQAVRSVQYRIDTGVWYPMSQDGANSRLWVGTWDASSLASGWHTIEVSASTVSGTRSNIITAEVQAAQKQYVGAAAIKIGKYTSGKRGVPSTFTETTSFKRGETVAIRIQGVYSRTTTPFAGATVQLAISGPQTASLTSSSSGSDGWAEAKWITSAPNKRGAGGTSPGSYTVTVTGMTAAGYTWDGDQSKSSGVFSLQ